MLHISDMHVRVVSAIGLAAFVLGTVLPMFDVIPFDDEVATARVLSTYGALLPPWAVWVWSIGTASAAAIGLAGLLFLWPPSRWFLATYAVAAVLGQPLLGLAVISSYEATLGGVFGTCLLWLATISFWSPFAERLRKGSGPAAA